MLGRTPPAAMVTFPRSCKQTPKCNNTHKLFHTTVKQGMLMMTNTLLSSSSLRTASWMCRGTILVFLLSLAALPASSRTSAARYSSTAACRSSSVAPAVAETEILIVQKLDMQPSNQFQLPDRRERLHQSFQRTCLSSNTCTVACRALTVSS